MTRTRAWLLLPLPLLAAIILLVLQIHTNNRLSDSIEAQKATNYKNAVNGRQGCVRAVEARERLINIFTGLNGNPDIQRDVLVWVQNATEGISEYPASQNPHKVNLVNCRQHYPVPPKP